MNLAAAVMLATLSVWDYPGLQFQHERLRDQLAAAVAAGETKTMVDACEKGVRIFPEDPTWRFNYACALARLKQPEPALDMLEKAIDLGFRRADVIGNDEDLKLLEKHPRYRELIEYAKETADRPLTYGPNAHVPQNAPTGGTIALGEQNFHWNFEDGVLVADMKLEIGEGGNAGDLYMNRDGHHSAIRIADFPGLTEVRLDSDGHARRLDLDLPNVIFPYPTFGNASLAFGDGLYWRSLPRMMMTREAWRMKSFQKMYLSNQFWVFPAHEDCPPVGKYGDVFASICPYVWVSAGSSYTDQQFVRAALIASRSLKRDTREYLVSRGLLTPTIMTLMRKSLKSVTNDVAYLSAVAHPSAFPGGSISLGRLERAAAELEIGAVPPIVSVSIISLPTKDRPAWPEPTYVSAYASAFVLRSDDRIRKFRLVARGADVCEFRVLRGGDAAKLTRAPFANIADLRIDRSLMSVTNRIDIGVFGGNAGTGWGAPSYVSFAVVDPEAPYSDPLLSPTVPRRRTSDKDER